MRRIVLHMVLSILALILLASKSCESDPGIDQEAGSYNEEEYILRSIKSEFETAYLTDEKLRVYNETGRQRMQDLTEYLSLYASRDMDSSFKPQIKNMIFNLFYDSTALVQLNFLQEVNKTGTNENLSVFLQEIENTKYQSVLFSSSDLRIVDPLHLEKDGRCTGILDCHIRISGIMNHDTVMLYQGRKQVDIIAVVAEKHFGDDKSLNIWQVFLDQVREHDAAI